MVLEVSSQQAPDHHLGAQYHIQTDQGDGRFFRFQTHSGQYRREILHPDGSQEGTYGWVDPNGVLRLYDYIADSDGYRIVKESLIQLGRDGPGSIHSDQDNGHSVPSITPKNHVFTQHKDTSLSARKFSPPAPKRLASIIY